jgi:hypothetical protein
LWSLNLIANLPFLYRRPEKHALTDPDSNILKSASARLRRGRSAAAYLLEIARSSQGGRYRKSAKIDALRASKDKILEAHR